MINEQQKEKGSFDVKIVTDWDTTPVDVGLGSSVIVVELPDDLELLFTEDVNSLTLSNQGDIYFLKTKEGTIPETSIKIQIAGRNALIDLEKGHVPYRLPIWFIMKSCSCYLLLSPSGAEKRKYILKTE